MIKHLKRYFIVLCFAGVFLIILGTLLFFFNQKEKELITEKNFTIIVLPDTQKYLLKKERSEIFRDQIQWIVDKKTSLNIKFVIHEGDIVENWNNEEEWQRAESIMEILGKNEIPYSVIPGNHDHKSNDTNGSSAFYNEYFPVSKFSDKDWWGGNYNQNNNNYQLLTIGKTDYIFLGLDWCPSNDEIDWANNILENYSSRKAILTTHGYLDDRTSSRKGIHGCNDTNYIWDDFIKKHTNLQIVLCGHENDDDGEAFRVDNNLAGKPVYQMLADYQDYSNGGNGWLRILEFAPSEDKIYVETYSPYLDKYDRDKMSQFVLDYEI